MISEEGDGMGGSLEIVAPMVKGVDNGEQLAIVNIIVAFGVTIEEPPIPFSPFSSADCTMINHFSFNDFIAIAFPDIARDLDFQT